MSASTRGPAAPPRVVVADDDGSLREALRDMLVSFGLEVVGQAADGRDAIVVTEATGPDVVLMDLRMPVMGGLEATEQIKRSMPDVHVIALTAYEDEGLQRAATKAGVDAYLLKGCEPRLIVEVVQRACAPAKETAGDPPEHRPGARGEDPGR